MIRVRVRDIENINAWYVNAVLPILMKKTVEQISANQIEKEMIERLNDKNFCADVLGLPVQDVVAKYDWTRQYKDTVDLLAKISNLYYAIRQINGKGKREIVQSLLKEFIEQNRNDIIDEVLKDFVSSKDKEKGFQEATRTNRNFKEFVTSLKTKIKRFNEIIESKFDYNEVLASSEIRGQLVMRLNIKVCPYCNRQYINPITRDNSITYMGDIDHILPKSEYTLFQLSLYNMIPACKVCNQLFKRDCLL